MSNRGRGSGSPNCAVRDCTRPKVAPVRKHCPFHAMTLPLVEIMPTAMRKAMKEG